jgi:hypothetical protein
MTRTSACGLVIITLCACSSNEQATSPQKQAVVISFGLTGATDNVVQGAPCIRWTPQSVTVSRGQGFRFQDNLPAGYTGLITLNTSNSSLPVVAINAGETTDAFSEDQPGTYSFYYANTGNPPGKLAPRTCSGDRPDEAVIVTSF